MTPTRARRASKAPNRFSSDNSHSLTTSSSFGSDHELADGVSMANQNMGPHGKTNNKIKLPTREPLKVKLPKLKRSLLQSSKEKPSKMGLNDVKIAKIKLPPFLSKKRNSNNNINSTANKESEKDTAKMGDTTSNSPKKFSPVKLKVKLPSFKTADTPPKQAIANNLSPDKGSKKSEISGDISLLARPSAQLDTSTQSTASTCNNSSIANTSFSSSDGNGSQKMEIITMQESPQEDSGIRCVCGVDDDIGVMVECEQCSTWQHGHCINVGMEDDAYEGYVCANCTYPPGEARNSLYQLTVGDKYSNRFDTLQALREKFGNNLEKISNATTENNVELLDRQESLEATNQLKRVMNSLGAKWKLLTGTQYDSELRIWSHPHWSPSEEENMSSLPENLYFVDRMKVNLKLNIRYMLLQLERRCDLIQLNLSLLALEAISANSSERLPVASIIEDQRFRESNADLRQVIRQIAESLRKYREQFDNLTK